jgi:hypothetical protein
MIECDRGIMIFEDATTVLRFVARKGDRYFVVFEKYDHYLVIYD